MAKARAYNIPFFMPMFPRKAEILFTTEEVSAYLRSLKLQVEGDHIDYLVKRGIVGLREIQGRGKLINALSVSNWQTGFITGNGLKKRHSRSISCLSSIQMV